MNDFSSDINRLSEQLDALLKKSPRESAPTTLRSLARQMTFSFFEEYAQWKFEHPYLAKIVRLLRFLFLSFMVIALFWWLAGTAAGKLIGMDGIKNRFVYGYYALVWANKGMPEVDSLQVAPKRYSGTIEKVVGDVLIVSYYDKGKSVRRLVRPANVVIADSKGFREWAKPYILKGITVDFYIPIDKASGHDVWAVVLWSKRIPVNVQLVEQGVGYPEHNPETQVINQVYAQYYFRRAKSG